MRSLLLAIVIIASLCPVISFASGHGGHGGGHCGGHGGGHGHGGHGGVHYGGHGHGGHFHTHVRAHYQYPNDELRYPMSGIHEIAMGTGAIPGRQVYDELIGLATPANYVTYRYAVSEHNSIGISAGTYTFWGRDTCNCNGALTWYNYKQTIIAVAADWRYTWYSGRNAQAYSGLSIGASHSLENDTYTDGTKDTWEGFNLSGQVTPIGVRVGHTLAWYLELGVGYKGVVSGGLSYEPNYVQKHARW